MVVRHRLSVSLKIFLVINRISGEKDGVQNGGKSFCSCCCLVCHQKICNILDLIILHVYPTESQKNIPDIIFPKLDNSASYQEIPSILLGHRDILPAINQI